MRWQISGEYIMGCTCKSDVHWPIDGSLRDRNGACDSVAVFLLSSGVYHGSDLTGVTFAVFNYFPKKISSGDWQMGLVIDREARDAQVAAVETIVRGVEGGPFGATRHMVGDFMGTDMAGVEYSSGERPYGSVEGRGHFVFRPTLDSDGEPVQAPNAMFVFAEGYKIGRAQGSIRAFGKAFSVEYGEFGRFSFNDEIIGIEREFRPSRITAVYGEAGTPKRT